MPQNPVPIRRLNHGGSTGSNCRDGGAVIGIDPQVGMPLAIELQIDAAVHIRNLNACAHQRLLGCKIKTKPCFPLNIPASGQPQDADRRA